MKELDLGNVSKRYFVHEDVIGQRAEEGVKLLASSDNAVYFDIDLIRQESRNRRNPYSENYNSFLAWINERMNPSGEEKYKEKYRPVVDGDRVVGVRTSLGGIVTWREEKPNDMVYVTRDEARKHEILSRRDKWELPGFLSYELDVLDSGLVRLDYPGDPTKLRVEDIVDIISEGNEELRSVYPNQYFLFNNSVLFKIEQRLEEVGRNPLRHRLVGEPYAKRIPYDFKVDCVFSEDSEINFQPRGLEQRIALSQILDPNIELCIVTGRANSGKTVIGYVGANAMVLGKNNDERKKGLVKDSARFYRPNNIVGGESRNEGWLPGDLVAKTGHWFEAWRDTHKELGFSKRINFDYLFKDPEDMTKEEKERFLKVILAGQNYYLPNKWPAFEKGHLPFEKGRTHTNKLLVMDEAQDNTPEELYMFLTRMGEGTKAIIHGDAAAQINNPSLSRDFNGLLWVATEIVRGRNPHPRASIINLTGNNRNQTAEIVARTTPPKAFYPKR